MMRSLRPSTISLWNDLHLSGQRLELLALLDNLQHASGLQVGMLEIVKEGEESQWEKFGDPDQIQTCQHLLFQSKSNKTGLQYYSILYHREGNFYPAYRFFTTGSTGRLNLVVTITIPGKLVTLGGGAEVEVKEMALFDFKPLLKDPKHSDVTLKCGDTRFLCHKVILAAR